MRATRVGLISQAATPLYRGVGSVADRATTGWEVVRLPLSDAGPDYPAAAGLLAGDGVDCITTDCAWNVDQQPAMRAAVEGRAVVSSVLLALPLLAAVFGRVGVVSINPPVLESLLPRVLPPELRRAISVAGVRDRPPWSQRLAGEDTGSEFDAFAAPLVAAARALVDQERCSALLLDCTSFLAFGAAVQAAVGHPTFTLRQLIDFLAGAPAASVAP